MKTQLIKLITIGIFVLLSSCNSEVKQQEQPNILWLVAEDLSPCIAAFGDHRASTPNLDRLAKEGVVYTNVYSVSGVCSPSRATLATGVYANSLGAHNMRTLFQQPAAKEKGIINYEAVPAANVKMVSEIMRENRYYCTNNSKEDYQFFKSELAWDESSIYAHWRNRPKGKPFFSVFNFMVTHESNLWNPFGRIYDLDLFPLNRENKTWWKSFEGKTKPLFVDKHLEVEVPPYLPNSETAKSDMRRMYSNIVEMDKHMGRVLDQLKADGLLENTIIVWYSDHGGPLPRQKRMLYDSGLHVPMIIRYPDKFRAGERDDRLISFVDFAPTLLSMAGINSKYFMQGQAFEGKYKSETNRKYIHAHADRFDESYDMIRAVRDQRFKYLRNFQPEKGYYLPLDYRENMATMKELLHMRDKGELNKIQMQWFRECKDNEELFDLQEDPHEINNLANNLKYHDKLLELRGECSSWMKQIDDKGFIPELELIEQFYPNGERQLTSEPIVNVKDNLVSISCVTKGASLGYRYASHKAPSLGWNIYKNPIVVKQNDTLEVIAHRIGFKPAIIKYFNK
tara:strand:- start:470 stop:2170 length:1701 start_codon:yes stop_codon:yes gene_type:complete